MAWIEDTVTVLLYQIVPLCIIVYFILTSILTFEHVATISWSNTYLNIAYIQLQVHYKWAIRVVKRKDDHSGHKPSMYVLHSKYKYFMDKV